jgi:hypothetical protein
MKDRTRIKILKTFKDSKILFLPPCEEDGGVHSNKQRNTVNKKEDSGSRSCEGNELLLFNISLVVIFGTFEGLIIWLLSYHLGFQQIEK